MGIDWWRNDPMLSSSEQGLADENRELRRRLEELEAGSEAKAPMTDGGAAQGRYLFAVRAVSTPPR